jgi:hypothetical protein
MDGLVLVNQPTPGSSRQRLTCSRRRGTRRTPEGSRVLRAEDRAEVGALDGLGRASPELVDVIDLDQCVVAGAEASQLCADEGGERAQRASSPTPPISLSHEPLSEAERAARAQASHRVCHSPTPGGGSGPLGLSAVQELECEVDAQCSAGVDEHEDYAAAARAARDNARRPGVDVKLGHEAHSAAVLADPGPSRHLATECLVERTGDRVAVQRLHPHLISGALGPNRSVLMRPGSWPASTSCPAIASTKPVGPQM